MQNILLVFSFGPIGRHTICGVNCTLANCIKRAITLFTNWHRRYKLNINTASSRLRMKSIITGWGATWNARPRKSCGKRYGVRIAQSRHWRWRGNCMKAAISFVQIRSRSWAHTKTRKSTAAPSWIHVSFSISEINLVPLIKLVKTFCLTLFEQLVVIQQLPASEPFSESDQVKPFFYFFIPVLIGIFEIKKIH